MAAPEAKLHHIVPASRTRRWLTVTTPIGPNSGVGDDWMFMAPIDGTWTGSVILMGLQGPLNWVLIGTLTSAGGTLTSTSKWNGIRGTAILTAGTLYNVSYQVAHS